jgi:hypothetical protein
MATSGVYTWTPTLANLLDEAAERCGIDPATLTHRHLKSMLTSYNLMALELCAEDADTIYRIDQESTSVSSGSSSFSLASGSIDVTDLAIIPSGETAPITLARITRQDYLSIDTTNETGQPTAYYVDHSSLNAPAVYFRPIPDATITVRYDRLRYVQDGTALSETPDASRIWYEAFVCGLASRFAEKYAPARYGEKRAMFEAAKRLAKMESRGRGPIMMYGKGFGRARRRRA